tara:strand:- start:2027 stop:3244 length:1218 start_codon:yes stop_codon:yes gene_type:complete
MNKDSIKKNYIYLFILLFLIASLAQSFSYSIFNTYFNTYIRMSFYYIFGISIIYIYFKNLNTSNFVSERFQKFYNFLIIYFFISIIFGIINAEDYWDYKYVFESYIPWTFTLFALFLGLNFKNHLRYFKNIFLILLILSILFLFLDNGKMAYVRILASLYIFILFANDLSLKYKILILSVSLVILFLDIGSWRTNQLRLIYLIFLYFFSFFILILPRAIIGLYSSFLLLVPIGILISFIIFNFDFFIYLSSLDLKVMTSENTRTFILNDIFNHFRETNSSYLIGSGPQSYFFTFFMQESMTHYNKIARYAVESGLLNLLLKNGLFGIILLLIVNFLAIKNLLILSNNLFSKKLALVISFNWIIFFIETPMTLQISSFLFFYLLGVAFSKDFLKMNDKEIKEYLNK